MSKMGLRKKVKKELERAKFLAFSDIEATERQLHGNSWIVVNKETAEAIFKSAVDEFISELKQEVKILTPSGFADAPKWDIDNNPKEVWVRLSVVLELIGDKKK